MMYGSGHSDENPYKRAKQEEQAKQSTDRGLRTSRPEEPFGSLEATPENPNIKVWLNNNAFCGPVVTPHDLKEAVRKLETFLGGGIGNTKKTDFARLSTVRIKNGSSTSGPVRRTSYKPSERYDYSVLSSELEPSDELTEKTTVFNPMLNEICADIVRMFLETSGYGTFVQTILNMSTDSEPHRVYAHVDWYPQRTYKAQTWHRDTRGVTLFVGLIYLNDTDIQGPDLIPNPFPLSTEMEAKRTTKCSLPLWILNPINELLRENKERDAKMRICQTAPVPVGGGIVWFIDELVYHRTPQRRAISMYEGGGLEVAISETRIGSLSQDDVEQGTDWFGSYSVKEDRKFVRIWITLDEPRKTKG